MAQLNFNARTVVPDAGQQDPVPSGWYNVVIDKSELKPTKDGTGTRLELRFNIIDGQYASKKLFEGLNLVNSSPQAQEIAVKQLSAICYAVNVLDAQDSQQLHNIPMKVKVFYKPAEKGYDAKNEIKAYKNINEVVTQPPAAPGAPAAFGAAPAAFGPPPTPPQQFAPPPQQFAAPGQPPVQQQQWAPPVQAAAPQQFAAPGQPAAPQTWAPPAATQPWAAPGQQQPPVQQQQVQQPQATAPVQQQWAPPQPTAEQAQQPAQQPQNPGAALAPPAWATAQQQPTQQQPTQQQPQVVQPATAAPVTPPWLAQPPATA